MRKAIILTAVFILSAGCVTVGEPGGVTRVEQLGFTRVYGPNVSVRGRYRISGVEAYAITYRSGGLTIAGFLIAPPHRPGRLPVLIYNRGGNRNFAAINQSDLNWLASFARRGYLVLASQYRGGPGSMGRDEFGGRDVNDVLALIRLTRYMPRADTSRIFMLGFSRGGLMTYRALAMTGAVRAAAVVGGVADLVSWYRQRGDRLRRVLDELVGGRPVYGNPAYRLRSPVTWARRIRTPLLILHGASDWRVSYRQSQNMANRLRQAGTSSRLVIVSGGNHSLGSHATRRDTLILDWFSRYGGPR